MRRLEIIFVSLLSFLPLRGFAQTAPASAPATSQSVIAPFDLADLPAQAEQTTSQLRTIQESIQSDDATTQVQSDLPALSDEITDKLEENTRLLSGGGAALDTLRPLEGEWRTYSQTLLGWTHQLTRRSGELEAQSAQISAQRGTWRAMQQFAEDAAIDPAVLQRIDSLLEQIEKTQHQINLQKQKVTDLVNRVTAQNVRVTDELAIVHDAANDARDRLLSQDSPPLWSAGARTQGNFAEDSINSFSSQLRALRSYVQRRPDRLILHAVLIALMAAGLRWMRPRVAMLVKDDSQLSRSMPIFALPVATAIVVSMLLAAWIYPQAPRLFWAILGSVALIPTAVLMRRLIAPPLTPLLYALILFCVLSLCLPVAASLKILSRGLFLLEMAAGVIFLNRFLKTFKFEQISESYSEQMAWLIRFACRVAMGVMLASLIANVLGFVGLAKLLGNGLLTSAYLALILDASLRAMDVVTVGVMHTNPLALTGVVRRHGPLLRRRIRKIMIAGAAWLWLNFTLQSLAIKDVVLVKAKAILWARPNVGSVDVSLGNILYFGLTIYASVLVARFARFILEEDIYPHVQLPRGVPYAVTTLLRYAIFFMGFILAVALLGYDMTKFTILAGAFGVGLGFGMQNIVNNFVSGLILLFERPVQVGDIIELDNISGRVVRIGIRASVLRTLSASEIIIPNGRLISDKVINWTLTTRQRGLQIGIVVAPPADPKEVMQILCDAAKNNPLVASVPPPQSYFVEFVGAGLKFELRVWTTQFEDWVKVRSEVSLAIHAGLLAKDIKLQ